MNRNQRAEAHAKRSLVTEMPAAAREVAERYFRDKLSYETDCWDVNHAIKNGNQDFVLVDVRSPALYAKGHVGGAINMPVGKIVESRLSEIPSNTLLVVYCAGPHCNGADRAARRLASLGRPVKIMIGGVTGWLDEGFQLVSDGIGS